MKRVFNFTQLPAKFKEIYNYAFGFSRDKGQKSVSIETAIGMWKLIFSSSTEWPLIDKFLEYVSANCKNAISKDTWTQLLNFMRTTSEDLSDYDEGMLSTESKRQSFCLSFFI